jgi:hypothetical protein
VSSAPRSEGVRLGSREEDHHGAALIGIGAGLEAVCASYPDLTWARSAARYVYYAGALLTTVGLVDGGTRAPWPTPPDPGK